MSCSDESPCPVYLELTGISAAGKKWLLAGNLHGPVSTLSSILLASEDNGATWREPTPRIPGAALEETQWLDPIHGWAAGEIQVPLARDPFILVTGDAGNSWLRSPVTEEETPGSVQDFWFESPDRGELVIDAGRSARNNRYVLYESSNGGKSWNTVSKSAQVPKVRRTPAAANADYRIATDDRTHAWVIESREGEKWNPIASFSIQVATCGSPPAPSDTTSDEK